MSKLLKILAALIGVVVILIVAAVVIVPLVVDGNDFKQPIIEGVKEHTGRDLVIADDVGLSVFPWVALELGGVQLSNAKGFGDQPFAKIGKASVRVKLIPLLSKKLEMDTVILDGVELDLQRDMDGNTNWQDLAQGEKTDSEQDESSEVSGNLAGLAIGGVKITNVQVSFDDRQAGKKMNVKDLILETGALAFGTDVPISLSASMSMSEPEMNGRVELKANANYQAGQQAITLSGLELSMMGKSDGREMKVSLSGETRFAIAEQVLAISGLTLNISAKGGDVPGGSMDAQLNANVDARLKQGEMNIRDLKLTAAGLQISGHVDGKNITDQPQFNGQLTLAEFNPQELLKALGQPAVVTADSGVLKKLSLASKFTATNHSIKLDGLTAVLDDSKLSGVIDVKQFDGPSVAMRLNIDDIDVDRYLPPATKGEPAKADASAVNPEAQASVGLPLGTLRKLDLNARLTIGIFKVNKLKMQKVDLTVTSKKGVLKINPLTGSLYQGSIHHVASLDVRGKTPKITSALNLKGVQIDPLLTDMNGESKIAGNANIKIDVKTVGLDADAATRNLNGTVGFEFLNGAYKGVNIAYQIRRAQALLKRKPAPKEESKQTDFTAMTGTAKIRNGVLDNRDFAMSTPLLRVKGAGTANLPKQTTDYGLKVSVVSTSKGQGGAGLESLKGVTIPVKVSGSFSDPKVGVDLSGALASIAKSKVKAKVEDKIKKKLGDKLGGGLLKGLFK